MLEIWVSGFYNASASVFDCRNFSAWGGQHVKTCMPQPSCYEEIYIIFANTVPLIAQPFSLSGFPIANVAPGPNDRDSSALGKLNRGGTSMSPFDETSERQVSDRQEYGLKQGQPCGAVGGRPTILVFWFR